MAGKGSQLRKGANLQSYWKNYPFDERNTVTYWANKLGESIREDGEFRFIALGAKITESQFLDILAHDNQNRDTVDLEMTDKDIEEMKECMNSMSFSEFDKIKK